MKYCEHYNDTYEPAKNAEEYGMQVNPDSYRVAEVLEKLGKNHQKYGAPYCPCMPTQEEDTICPCKYMRKFNVCRCGMYVQKGGN